MTGSSDTTCLDGAGSRLALSWGLGAVPPLLHCRSSPLAQQACAGSPCSPRAEGRLGKDRWKGSRPQLHTLATSSEILPETASVEAPEGPGEWIESHGRQLSSPGLG